MARRRRRRYKRPPDHELQPEHVLSGQVAPDVISLLRLIHRVNPTQDTGLSGDEVAARYRVKSQLQSLLLERFLDQLILVPDPDEDNVVGIRHRWGEGDACHAVVPELEPAARSLVQHALDTPIVDVEQAGGELAPSTGGPAGGDGPDDASATDLVADARLALDEYDYESARHLLDDAMVRSGGRADAAVALLELLVDHLADASAATQVECRLSADAAVDPLVRTLLALASARIDDCRGAERLIRGLTAPRVPEVYLALARAAVRAEDPGEASRWLDEARRGGVAEALLGPVAEAIGRLWNEAMGERESKLEDLDAAGDDAAAEQLAREILDAGHDSHLARRVLRRLDAEHRAREAEALLAAADDAEADGAPARAVSRLRRVLDLDPDRAEALAERVRRLDALARERSDAERVDRVVASLAADDQRDGLEAYLELESRLRDRVRRTLECRLCAWLDQIEPAPSGSRVRAAVTGVIAMARASELLAGGKPTQAIATLEPHLRSLDGVDDAGRVLAAARARVEEEARARAVGTLEAALRAADAGNLARAEALAAVVDCTHLLADESLSVGEILRQASARRDDEQARARLEALSRSGDLVAARHLARELASRGTAADRESWQGRVAELDEAIRAAWAFESIEDPGPSMRPGRGSYRLDVDVPVWLTAENRLTVHECWGAWLFQWVVGVDSGQVERVLSMRCPAALGRFADMFVTEDGLWVVGSDGHSLRMIEGEGISDWLSLAGRIESPGLDACYTLIPATEYVWCQCEDERCNLLAQVFPVSRESSARTVTDAEIVRPVVGHPDHLVMVGRYGGPGRDEPWTALYPPRGSGGDRKQIDLAGLRSALTATVHPDGSRVVLVTPAESPGDAYGSAPIRLQVVLDEGRLGPGLVVERSDYQAVFSVATSLEAQRVFLVCFFSVDVYLLVCLRPEGDRLVEQYCVPVSSEAFLAQDEHSRRVVLVQPLWAEQPVVVLSSATPDVGPYRVSGRLPAIGTADPLCGQLMGERAMEGVALAQRLRDLPEARRAEELDGLLRDAEHDPEHLVCIIHAVQGRGLEHLADDAISFACARHGASPALKLELASRAARLEDWPEVVRLLDGLDPNGLGGRRARHCHHLLGLARLQQGDAEGAKAVWQAGRAFEGDCRLDGLETLADAQLSRSVAADLGDGHPVAVRLAAAIRHADQAIDSGDTDEVVATLDQPWVWSAQDMQSLVRLAEAYLLHSGSGAVLRFKKRLCLAALCSRHDDQRSEPSGFTFLDLAWSPERIAETVERARAWLDDQ